MYSQGICPAAPLAGPHQIWFCSSLPFSPAVSPCIKQREQPEAIRQCQYSYMAGVGKTHVSTWFSNERMTGYWEVLKALSAMASITSCSTAREDAHLCSAQTHTLQPGGLSHQKCDPNVTFTHKSPEEDRVTNCRTLLTPQRP